MKKIVERTTRTFYQCKICKTKHSKQKACQECEEKKVEAKRFKIKDVVRVIELRTCMTKDKNYSVVGKVVKIIGPMPADSEYEQKWLGGKSERINSHVFRYRVEFRCPHCKEKRSDEYYAPELKKPKKTEDKFTKKEGQNTINYLNNFPDEEAKSTLVSSNFVPKKKK